MILTISPTRHPVCVQAHKRTNWAASLCRRHRACDAVRGSTDRSRGCRLQFRYANSPLLNPSLSHRLQQPRSLRLRLQVPWCRTFSSRWLTICMCVCAGGTEVTFYLVDAATSVSPTAVQVTQLLLSRVTALATLGECSLSSVRNRIDPGYIGAINVFSDGGCSTQLTNATLTSSAGECLTDFGGAVSARLYCTGIPLGQVGVRLYDNVGCNMPTLSSSTTSAFNAANTAGIPESKQLCAAVKHLIRCDLI